MLNYVLSWVEPLDRLFDVSISFSAPVDDPRLVLPSWRPGRYLIQNFAANVRDWDAGEHRIRKDGKSSWRVSARAGEPVTVRYRYYAGLLDAGSSFLDTDEAYFNGSNLFMLVEGMRGEEHRLTIAAPADWAIETQLPRASVIPSEVEGLPATRDEHGAREGDPSTPLRSAQDDTGLPRETAPPSANRHLPSVFLARDYDHLIDSPTICSPKLTRHTFEESGATIHLVFRDDDGIDTEQYVEPVRAVVREQAALMGGFPTPEYRFLYHVRDKWHGVEHEASSSIIVRRGALVGTKPGDDGYDHLLSITSHELFHLWNVKRILPAAFAPYDYSTETPTRLLWAMEGITSYYGELTLVRSGQWKLKRYLDHLRKEIETLESLPARKHLSLSDVSFDAWLADASHMHDRGNATYSFYTKGELVALLLDLTIRTRSEGTKSLDDVMRLLWNEYGAVGRGLEEDAIERVVARVCDVGDFFAKYVDGVDELPYAELLSRVGIEVTFEHRNAGKPSLGAGFREDDSRLHFQNVCRGGAAMEAGAMPGDELIAIDGMRVLTEHEAERIVGAMSESSSVEMLIARAGILHTLSLPARLDPRVQVSVRSTGESELRRQWLQCST